MGLLRDIFGPSQEEVWRELSRQIGGEFSEGGLWKGQAVQVRVADWIITLDTHTVSSGDSSTTYTRLRAPFVNRDGFQFTINRAGFFTDLGKLFGMQDVEVGDPHFDPEFVIQSNQPERVILLLQDRELRSMIHSQDQFQLTVRDDEGWLAAHFPDGVDELYFSVTGVIKEIPRLRKLYEIFALVLNRIQHLDSGHADDAAMLIETLAGPSGRIVSNHVTIWDGVPARVRAAQSLGDHRTPATQQALLKALGDVELEVRAAAIQALGRHGDASMAAQLIPFLGAGGDAGALEPEAASEALDRLGEGEPAAAFRVLLSGQASRLATLDGPHRAAYSRALTRALEARPARQAAAAAQALAEWGVVEALPQVRRAMRSADTDPAARTLLDQAIRELERRSSLPRPAEAGSEDVKSLPIAGSEG